MTFGFWTVILCAFLPVFWAGVAKFGTANFDNAAPRASLDKATGWAQRANWAQMNSYEAFPPFAAGILIAHYIGAEQSLIDMIAGIFLVARIAHGIVYIADYPTLRSLSWTVGFLAVVGLFVAPVFAQ